MATRSPFPDLSNLPRNPLADSELARRIELAREECESEEDEKGRPAAWRMFAELEWMVEPVRRIGRKLEIAQASTPQTVLILPGFGTRARKMRYMAKQIERAGHKTKRWGLGFNWGAQSTTLDRLEQRLIEVHGRYERPVALLGWSLGGIYARELAKRQPQLVSKVITMGTPFSGSPRSNNVWRAYQFIAGHRVDRPPIEADLAEKPPVETIAFWSPRDGAIAPRCARGNPGERDREVALRCTHMGFSYAPEAIYAVLSELERD